MKRNLLILGVLQILLSACGETSGGNPVATIPEVMPAPPPPPHDPFNGVLFGSFEDVTESRGHWIWGDSVNVLCHQWSIAGYYYSGWFYGSNVSWSSADVYVLDAGTDPLSIVAAENFDFTAGSARAEVGDTVFFRGINGFFGAWTIVEINGDPDTRPTMSGIWFFRADGGGDFTGELKAGEEELRRGGNSCENY